MISYERRIVRFLSYKSYALAESSFLIQVNGNECKENHIRFCDLFHIAHTDFNRLEVIRDIKVVLLILYSEQLHHSKVQKGQKNEKENKVTNLVWRHAHDSKIIAIRNQKR